MWIMKSFVSTICLKEKKNKIKSTWVLYYTGNQVTMY